MLITIYDSNRKKKADIGVNDSSTQVKEIHSDNVLSLSFTLFGRIELDVNNYVDFEGERYWLTEKYRPTQKSNQEWEYNVKLYGIESLIKRFLVLKTVDGENEPVFSLTAPARDHVAMIVECINLGMGTTDWKVGEVADTGNIIIDYEGTYCNEGLKKVAEASGTEWWFDGMTVNVCRCEHGDELALGYGNGILSIEPGTADNVKFYTRLFPTGSTRNIDPSRYGHSRLQLPGGIKYVDVNTDKYGIIHHYEQDAFSHIYPKRIGTISSVRSEEVTDEDGNPFTVYYFKDSGLDFDPNAYEIAGLVKQVTFQNGELNGREFEVNFNSETREFEIITIWPYDDGTQLPGGSLVPESGDEYILWNIRMPDEYYPIAEAEYLAAVNEYNAAHGVDVSVYKCPTDHVWVEDNGAEFYLGRRVRLESSQYFPETGYRSSRITKITRRVNLPSYVELEISDAVSKGGMENIEDSIDEVRNIVQTSNASFPDVVRTWESTPASDYNVFSSKRTLKEIANRALSRLNPDVAQGLIQFLDGLQTGTYKEGLSGSRIDKDGNAEFGKIITRLRAILAELQVNGAAEFRGQLSSEEFISGFLNGKGWAIVKKEVLNALGVPETKYTGEFDEIVVRGMLRVFSLVASQMLGENDNRVFTGMMEVDHFEESSGKVWLRTQDGKLFNPFRKDDYIMVQQYNGMPSAENEYYITKHYELIVESAGVGSTEDGEDRLDWVTFSGFLSADGKTASETIKAGDTFTRVDNATDADRKGLIQIITVGTATPYMDVVYGMKTDPANSLKGRIGNLQGIYHHLFGWLEGFGEFLMNLYAVGDFRLRRTGESLDAKIEMLKGLFSTSYGRVTYDLTEEDNYLKNATFSESMEGWITENDTTILLQNGEPLLLNGGVLNTAGRYAAIEQYDGRNMLRLNNGYVRQSNADIRKPGTHKEYIKAEDGTLTDEYVEVKDTLFLSLKILAKTDGTLTVGIQGAGSEENALPFAQIAVTSSMDWQIFQWSGTWDGTGDFLLQYTGDMYVSLLSLTDKALDDFKKSVSTRIEQTDSNIRLLGTNVDNLNGTVTELGIELDAAEERISIYANKVDSLEGTVTNLGIRLDAAESDITIYADKINSVEGSVTKLGVRLDAAEEDISIYAAKTDENTASISALRVDVNSISSTVTSVQGDLEAAEKTAAAAAKAAHDRADEAYSEADSAWWKAYYAQQDADSAQSTADDAYAQSVANATAIEQNATSISAIAGLFDSDGHLLEGSGWVTTTNYNALYSKVYSMDGQLAAKAELSTSVQYDPDTGLVTSAIKLTADKITLEGVTTINNSFSVGTDGTTRIAGFTVSGNGLINSGFNNDAYVIFRNDTYNTFAGIGGNILPASTGLRAVARFENHDTTDQWGFAANYTMLVSAQGGRDNVAIGINGGSIYGFAMKNTIVGTSVTSKTLERSDYNVLTINTSECTLTLPTMQLYDDGHVIRIKRLGSGGLKIKLGYCYTWNGTSYRYTRPVLIYNQNSKLTGTNTLELGGVCDSMELVWCRDIQYTIDNTTYYGAWVQYKLPRDW